MHIFDLECQRENENENKRKMFVGILCEETERCVLLVYVYVEVVVFGGVDSTHSRNYILPVHKRIHVVYAV